VVYVQDATGENTGEAYGEKIQNRSPNSRGGTFWEGQMRPVVSAKKKTKGEMAGTAKRRGRRSTWNDGDRCWGNKAGGTITLGSGRGKATRVRKSTKTTSGESSEKVKSIRKRHKGGIRYRQEGTHKGD